jgi:hypothetical protein
MSKVDIAKKYRNFLAPKNQIIINNEDILEKYGIEASAISVEETIEGLSKFNFTVNDPQLLRMNNKLFKLNKNVVIKMGYTNTLETMIEGKIESVKSFFPSNEPPHIEVYGRAKNFTNSTQSSNTKALFDLTYGKMLLSFTSITSTQNQNSKVASVARKSAFRAPTNNLRCSGECIGLPELKIREFIGLNGIGKNYDGIYYIEKVSHKLDGTGYTTEFEARPP